MHSPIYLVSTCEETGKKWLEAKSLSDIELPDVGQLHNAFIGTDTGMDWVDDTPGAGGWDAPELLGNGAGTITQRTSLAQEIVLTPKQCEEYAQKFFQALNSRNEAIQALAKVGKYRTAIWEYMVEEEESFTSEQKERWCSAIRFLEEAAPFWGEARVLGVADIDSFENIYSWWGWFCEYILHFNGQLPEEPVKVWVLTGAVLDYHY